ncbi:MAG: CBS domain-containing protein [Spirulina sp.]
MTFSTLELANLEEAIDRHPLIVASDTLATDAIALMSQIRGQTCHLETSPASESNPFCPPRSHSSCVLVMERSQLQGIFTERDIVRLVASDRDIAGVPIREVMTAPVISISQNHFQDIFAALFLFRRYRIRHLPITDEAGQLVGVVSAESLRRILRPANLLKIRRVVDVMTKQVVSAFLQATVLEIAQLMTAHRVSCIVIVQTDGDRLHPVGIVTERDIVQFQALQLNLPSICVRDVMSTPLFLLNPEDSLWRAHQEMQKRHVRRLVVSRNWGRDLGIVTQTSLLKVFDPMEMYDAIEMLQQTVKQLEAEKSQLLQQIHHDRGELRSSNINSPL